MTTQAPTAPPVSPFLLRPHTAAEYRAAGQAILVRLHQLEDACRGATGRAYREITDEANALEALAISYTHCAARLEVNHGGA